MQKIIFWSYILTFDIAPKIDSLLQHLEQWLLGDIGALRCEDHMHVVTLLTIRPKSDSAAAQTVKVHY